MLNWRKLSGEGVTLTRACASMLLLSLFTCHAQAQLSPNDVLLLVNQDSPTSIYVSRLYRRYYPQIASSQVLFLAGLTDCSGPGSTPADEIITRQQYNQLIAGPVRAYLADPCYPGRITQVKVIITTAGMPYRIEDTVFGDVIYPNGCNYNTVINQESSIDAASVESELTCLWHCDYDSNSFPRTNRMVNPYQGYRSSMTAFPRQLPGSKVMRWSNAISALAPLVENPRMEGYLPPPQPGTPPDFIPKICYGTTGRRFHVGDMYLTARLDGPKNCGQSAIFAVRRMLERARRASSPLFGVNPAQAVAVLDDAPMRSDNFDNNRTFNLTQGIQFLWYDASVAQPPDACQCRTVEDYVSAYVQTTDNSIGGTLNIGSFHLPAGRICVMLDRRNYTRTSQADLDNYASMDPGRFTPQGVVLLASWGRNGDEGNPPSYLLAGGAGSTPLFNPVNGAFFTSIESFNALTMFSDVNTAPVAQGKLVDFLAIGGTAAIGHCFEPQPDAAIDNEFLLYNLLADNDADGRADLAVVEAAFTALPYVSWSEVLVADPLMRIAYGPGGLGWSPIEADINCDDKVDYADLNIISRASRGRLYTSDPALFDLYDDLCDQNEDLVIDIEDFKIIAKYFHLSL